jgi:hypothetical protein
VPTLNSSARRPPNGGSFRPKATSVGRSTRRGWLAGPTWAGFLGLLSAGCDSNLNLGTDVLWSDGFEDGGLISGLSAAPGTGGIYLSDAGESGVALSMEQHHSGHFSVKMSSETPGGAGIYKTGTFPVEAYYSAWYYVPKFYVTTLPWSILRFAVSPDPIHGPLEVDLWSLPDGTLTLELYDTGRSYLLSPLPAPVPIVPIGRWFQLEALYLNSTDSSGHFTLWFDGTPIYDFERSTSSSTPDGGLHPSFYFEPCSFTEDVVAVGDAGPNVVLYVDDIAISWSRVTPKGVLEVPP